MKKFKMVLIMVAIGMSLLTPALGVAAEKYPTKPI